jgi:hypothetical protein
MLAKTSRNKQKELFSRWDLFYGPVTFLVTVSRYEQPAVLGFACSNSFTLTAAEATVIPLNNGIFNVPQWIKSSNDRK